ncbi:lipopolysaccharide biosynthesis protein [Plantactinospora sp. KBS50]|uniref:lipopolysaccharide biosynthesis protein n=1 Tax=Plantactinospora sp. KBS50 TaxID=2024580 RepID=UPI0012FD752F|nr:lipopolysaccharide biosynthesis protein [Plantactinospora sp. KBS50]
MTAAERTTGPSPTGHTERVRSAIGWSYLLTAGRFGSSVLVTFLLAKLLGPAEFGIVAMGTVLIMIVQTVLQQGLTSAIVQREGLTPDQVDTAFVVLAVGGVALTLLTIAIAPVWALVNREPQLTAVTIALAPTVLLQGLSVVPETLLRRELQFRAVAIRTLLAATLSGLLGLGLALAGAGVWALVGQQVASALISLVVLWLVCPWRPGRRPRLAALRELWAFSAHAANAGLGAMLSSRMDLIVTGLVFGPVATGIYRLAARLPDVIVDITVRSLQQVALPALSRLQHDRVSFARYLARLQHLGAVAGLPVLGVLAAVAGPLVRFLGPQWAGTELPLRLLCLFGAVNVYGVLLGPALQAIGQPGRLAVITWTRGLTGAVVLVSLGSLLHGSRPPVQAAGVAAAGVLLQLAVNAVALHVTVRRAAGASLRRFVLPTLPALAAAALAAAAPLLAGWLGIARLTPTLGLLVLGGGATLAAGVVLLAADRPLRHALSNRLRRRAAGTDLAYR